MANLRGSDRFVARHHLGRDGGGQQWRPSGQHAGSGLCPLLEQTDGALSVIYTVQGLW